MPVNEAQTVSQFMLRGLLRAAERAGASSEVLLQRAGIEAEVLEGEDRRISRSSFERACQIAVQLTDDEAFGLHWAEPLMNRGFGPISAGLTHATTLRTSFLLLARFERFFTEVASHQIVEGPREVSVRVASLYDRPLGLRRTLAELSTAWFVKLIRTIQPRIEITGVELAYDAPSYHREYERIYQAPVSFGHAWTQISFAANWLDARADETEVAADNDSGTPDAPSLVQPARSARTPACSPLLHRLLRQHVPERVDMRRAARELGFHERTLRRYLTAEGRSFKEIEFAALAEYAKRRILHEQKTVEETAAEMGFATVPAFHRAFKRWTGHSPKHVQAQALRVQRS